MLVVPEGIEIAAISAKIWLKVEAEFGKNMNDRNKLNKVLAGIMISVSLDLKIFVSWFPPKLVLLRFMWCYFS